MTTSLPYGTWPSPISSALVAEAGVGLDAPAFDRGDLYWLELRPKEGGRYVLVRRRSDGRTHDVTPKGMSVRTRLHEYGGVAYLVRDGVVFFANDEDQRVYRQPVDGDGSPVPLTPEPAIPRGLRYADFDLGPDGLTLVAVRERHRTDGEPVAEIVALRADATEPQEPVVVVDGNDFFASPRLAPEGNRLAWLAWDHPRMPWDGTELFVADADAKGRLSNVRKVAGGPTESVLQPTWSPDGVLHHVSDRTGWWNLYVAGEDASLFPVQAECAHPLWSLGMTSYAFVEGGLVLRYVREGRDHLVRIDPANRTASGIPTPYVALGHHVATDGGRTLAVVAGAFDRAPEVARLDLATDPSAPPAITVMKRSTEVELDADDLSPAEAISFPTRDGEIAHALYYAPKGKGHEGSPDEAPPLVVRSHGGPTASASSILSLGIQFWTSRGFAVVDVDYRGSTGYGRAYRDRLQGNWGILDRTDCADAALHLAAEGKADPKRLLIRGGSAGGYTTLCALAFDDAFAAGASHFGVGDLEALALHTHKFESRYLDGLIGPYPERKDLYVERSPIHHAESLSCPIILLQGLEDRVVPPEQAEAMAAALDAKGLPWAYVPFEGEQHGFRQAKNIRRALEAELYFYGRVLGFAPADELEAVEIHNLR
jgi:dipeptidyl aminopeptidase/acylaminoacyl peptidase